MTKINSGKALENIKSLYSLIKKIGPLSSYLLFFAFVSLFGFLSQSKIISVISLFYLISILLRIPDTYSDVFPFESILPLSFILMFVTTKFITIFFALSAIWLTKFVSPFGPIESYSETINESISISAAIILISLIPFNGNLLLYLIYFNIIRAAVFYLSSAITSPATILTDLFYGLFTIPMIVIESYLIVLFIGTYALGFFGITGWTLISLRSIFF